MPLDHMSLHIPASRLAEAITFFKAALAPLGMKELRSFSSGAAFGEEAPWFWVYALNLESNEEATALKVLGKNHFALSAESEEQVQQFHEAALKAGGKDNGAPGLRPRYGPHYYAAFVRDPVTGANIEVVCRK